VQGDIFRGRVGDVLGVGSYTPPSQAVVEGNDEVSGGNLLARWDRDLGGGAGFRLQTYFDRTTHHAINFSETRNTIDVDFLMHSPLGGRHALLWGGGMRVSPSDFTPRLATLTLHPEDRTHRIFSAFAQDELTLVSNALWLTAGSKFEHNNDSGLEVQPTARLLWRHGPRETWWTSVTRAVRTPSRLDTDLDLANFALADPLAYLAVVGSKDFAAETLVGVEAGYRRLIGSSLYVDVAAFHNEYDKLSGYGDFNITAESEPIPHLRFELPFINLIGGTTDGFEIAPDWRPSPWWALKGAYSLMTMNLEKRPATAGDEVTIDVYEGSSPRHQAFVQSTFTLPHGIELNQSVRFAGRIRSHDIPRYTTGDARLAWRTARGLTLAITGRNLFQPHHTEFFRDEIAASGIRRSVFASLTWQR
jgi:iron complex outermembrane receptor protein